MIDTSIMKELKYFRPMFPFYTPYLSVFRSSSNIFDGGLRKKSYIWGKVFKSGLNKKGCLPQNLLKAALEFFVPFPFFYENNKASLAITPCFLLNW